MRGYIGLGSNLGDRAGHLARARLLLSRGGARPVARSSIYRTDPVGDVDQGPFLNQVVAVAWSGSAGDLLRICLGVERAMGRVRTRRMGPRIIDLDLLLFGDRVVSRPGITVPHPRMHLRRFVLVPLVEIAPGVRHPRLDRTARELLAECPDRSGVRRLANVRKRRNCAANHARL